MAVPFRVSRSVIPKYFDCSIGHSFPQEGLQIVQSKLSSCFLIIYKPSFVSTVITYREMEISRIKSQREVIDNDNKQ